VSVEGWERGRRFGRGRREEDGKELAISTIKDEERGEEEEK
jgi:hypothetical protein